MDAERLKVAYLVSQYPWPSHVFVEREVEGLRSLGVQVDTFTVRASPEDRLLGTDARLEAARTVAVLDRRAVSRSLRRLATQHPRALATVTRTALETGPTTLRARTWQIFYLAEAAHLHALMRERGLRHLHVHLANNSADIARLVVDLGTLIDGPGSGWSWSLTMHGPTEFEAVERFDLPGKIASAAGVACISDFTRSQLMRHLAPDKWPKLKVVRMSVDLDRYGFVDRSERPDGAMRLLYVGRLVPEKGAPVLIEALAELRRRGVPVQARLVGAGEIEADLRRQVAAAGLQEHVELMGARGQDELPALYEWADVFCLPSFQEGLPVVLMEAMATGLPTVTTAIAGIPELVHDGLNGRVLTAGRTDLITEALTQLARDPELRRTMGVRGRRDVERGFSTPVTAQAQLEFLRWVAQPSV